MVGFALRAAIILTNPIIWGGDSVIHLFNRFALLQGHQLPLLQVLIAAVSWFSLDPTVVQFMIAAFGSVAGLGFYYVVADLLGEQWALPAALLFATHPLLVAVSTVPFQEMLMLAGLLFAFHFFYTDRMALSSICLALACLTRFEAWAACPVFAVAYFWRNGRSAWGVLLFGWAPLAWIFAHQGLASTGHFVIERSLSIWRLQRYVYLGWITAKFTPIPVLLLAAAGAWLLARRRIGWRWWMQIAFVSLFALAIPFSAHGIAPDPERYVSSREVHIFICFTLLLSAAGLTQWPRWNRWIVASGMSLGIIGSFWYVRVETLQPEAQLDYAAAQFLDRSVQTGERALLLTNPVTAEAARLYLDKARETGGEAGLRQAKAEMRDLAAAPPDYQRVVVHSRLARERLLAPPAADCAEWVAVWNDYPGVVSELEAQPVQVLRAGKKSVSIFRRVCSTF